MTATKSKLGIQTRRGTRTDDDHKRLLDTVATTLFRDHGLTVLSGAGDLWARLPGMLSWFAVAYRYDPAVKGATAFGCVRVSFVRSGRISIQVMGVGAETTSYPDLNLSWK